LEKELYNFVSKTPQLTSEEEILVKSIAKDVRNEASKLLGLFQTDPISFWKTEREKKLKPLSLTLEEVEKLVREREKARKEKNFQQADRIREELQKKGIILKDTKTETFWWVE
jgi:cysteinyl-tRNA synthetase